MNAKQYLEAHPREHVIAVLEKAGTTREYLYQISAGIRNASIEKALSLVVASKGELDFISLITATGDRRKLARRAARYIRSAA